MRLPDAANEIGQLLLGAANFDCAFKGFHAAFLPLPPRIVNTGPI
jgi:hypothetical protein